jgi:outer membrane receptor protein involved in Fe transport
LFDKYDWDVFYTHGESHQKEDDPRNQNNAKMYAAQDAVLNGAGNPVCYVSTTGNAGLYPGCVPMNPFGPTALTRDQYDYFTQDTNFIATYIMDDMGASIAGTVFDLPAGPLKAALSTEYREVSYGVVSNAPPGFVDCTGLRLCNSSTSLWQGNVAANQATQSENVLEFAAEADIPLLKDLPLVQSLSANVAGRYTDYSVSGAVNTWKVGLDYHVNDDVRFRATTSIDIRAPTLNDLFSPLQLNHAGFNDLHTGNITQIALTQTQGNPNLTPEVARTYTAGIVLTPSFIPGLTASVDYYKITLKNAIGSIGGSSIDIQHLCEDSGGVSQYCSLYVRPLPFSDHSPANYPTAVITQQLNTALNRTEGWDIEVDYGFEMADVWDSLDGSTTLRVLVNEQPFNTRIAYPGAPATLFVAPKARITSFVDYALGAWTFSLEDRWLSSFPRSSRPGVIFYTKPRGEELNYVDVNINRTFTLGDGVVMNGYFSVQNLFNKTPPVEPTNTATPGLFTAGIGTGGGNVYGFDQVGRYFTIGARFAL